MLTERRQFLGCLLAAGLTPKPTWADVGDPAFLSAAATPEGTYLLCGIDADLNIVFQRPLPDRGHAAAAHPTRPEAVAFARRPGTFAVVIDCATGRETARLAAPEGRHFYGHGTFSKNGTRLYTTENDYAAGRGRIGVWDATDRYQRIDEWDSGGVGPHDIKRLPETDVLVVANGGIDTHPESGRIKLNIPTMRPNLAYVEEGIIIETAEMAVGAHKNSIRHLAINDAHTVAFGMQWQGEGHPETLVGLHRRGETIALMDAPADEVRQMQSYVGSVAFAQDGQTIAVTSPRGGRVQIYDAQTRTFTSAKAQTDVCGISSGDDSLFTTTGTGSITAFGRGVVREVTHSRLFFDNHLIAL